MKKFLISVLLVILSSTCFAKVDIEKLKTSLLDYYSEPKIFFVHKYSFLSYGMHCVPGWREIVTNNFLIDEYDRKIIAYKEGEKYIKQFSPGEILPLLYEFLEDEKSQSLVTMRYMSSLSYKTNPLPIYVMNKQNFIYAYPISLTIAARNCIALLRNEKFYNCVNATLYPRCPRDADCGNMDDFWWYEGRKYMPELWNEWYVCWCKEMKKESPSENVVKELLNDVASFGMYTLPHIEDSIKHGDYSLDPLLKKLNSDYETFHLPETCKEFLNWYSTNSYKYTLPPCEGLENVRKRLTNKKLLQEISEIKNYYNDADTILHPLSAGQVAKYEKSFKAYAESHPKVPDYWYHEMKEGEEKDMNQMMMRIVRDKVLAERAEKEKKEKEDEETRKKR